MGAGTKSILFTISPHQALSRHLLNTSGGNNEQTDNKPQARCPKLIVRGSQGCGEQAWAFKSVDLDVNLSLTLSGCVTFSKSLNVSEPYSPLCKRQGKTNTHVTAVANEVERCPVSVGLPGGPDVMCIKGLAPTDDSECHGSLTLEWGQITHVFPAYCAHNA